MAWENFMDHDFSAGLGPVLLAVLVEEASAVGETPEQCRLRRVTSLAAARDAAIAAEYSARLIAQAESSLRCAFSLADAFDSWFGTGGGAP